MKNSIINTKLLPFFLLLLIVSCASKKDVVYYQGPESTVPLQSSNSYEIKTQPDDLLMIIVSAEDPEIAAPFNLKSISMVNPSRQDLIRGQETMQLYLVDSAGFIEFPILGKLSVSGLTRSALLKNLQQKISLYIKNPIVNIRLMNFKVSLQGEVNLPGSYNIPSDRITLIEALSMAKDLTIYGKRDNILIIREVDGVKSFNRIDITKADFINSPFYYLSQNDVVYVEPNKTKINGAAVGPNTGVIVSASSLLIALITLLTRL